MAKVFGIELPGGSQQMVAVGAAVVGVLLVMFALRSRDDGGGGAAVATSGDIMRAVQLGSAAASAPAAATASAGADFAQTGADIARSGLSLVERTVEVLGDTTRDLVQQASVIGARQTDLIGLLARPPESLVVVERSPFREPVVQPVVVHPPAPVFVPAPVYTPAPVRIERAGPQSVVAHDVTGALAPVQFTGPLANADWLARALAGGTVTREEFGG